MPNTIKKLWSLGTNDNSVKVRRQIQLCNQIALLFALVTAFPYQLFYAIYDFTLYRPLFLANLLFMSIYVLVLRFNYRRKYTQAKNVLVVNTCAQLLIVNYFIGADAGVYLYYFTLAAILVFLYQNLSTITYFSILAAIGSCIAITHFLFSPGAAITPIPSPWVDIMYVSSLSAVLGLLGVFLLFFRNKIDQAEAALERKNKHFEKLSNTDPLTGLANRRALDDTLEKEWARLARSPGALSVIMCDVDYFKSYNDLYGHDGGDACLRQIADALKARKSTIIFIRPLRRRRVRCGNAKHKRYRRKKHCAKYLQRRCGP